MNVVEYMEAVIAERDTLREREDYVWQVLAEAGIKREDCAAVPGAPVQVPGWGVLSLRAERDDLRAQLAKVTKERDAQRRELDRIADSREVEGDGMHGPGEWERLRSERDALAAEIARRNANYDRQRSDSKLNRLARSERLAEMRRRHKANCDALVEQRDSARAECERLRKLFDDAGAGEHNVLALIDHYQDEALKATSELVQARQLVALLEDRISDVEDRDDDARTVCEWAATVALKSTDVHNAATRYLTGVQSPLRARLAEVERERDALAAERDRYKEAFEDKQRVLTKYVNAGGSPERIAALESTADDARMVADYVIDAPYALSKYADAAAASSASYRRGR